MSQRQEIEALRKEIAKLRDEVAQLRATPKVENHYHTHLAPAQPMPLQRPIWTSNPPTVTVTSSGTPDIGTAVSRVNARIRAAGMRGV